MLHVLFVVHTTQKGVYYQHIRMNSKPRDKRSQTMLQYKKPFSVSLRTVTLLLLTLALAITLVSCGGGAGGDDPPKVIANEWRMTLPYGSNYQADSGDTMYNSFSTTIGENTITLSGGDFGTVTLSGVYTKGGGAVTNHTPGKWAYVYDARGKIGYITTCTPSSIEYELYIGICTEDYVADSESYNGITLNINGIPEYPAFRSWGIF